jgi:uncharacterized protein YndB with AHSA1/START domain
MSADDLTLQIERRLNAPLANVWRCWTEPELLQQWFCPKPWRVTQARLEWQTGGQFFTHMEGPNGEAHDLDGVVLLVEPQRRILFTDAYRKGWIPSARAFMTGECIFSADGDATHYTARAHHWSAADKAEHEGMGFYGGWNAAADQLEALARGV